MRFFRRIFSWKSRPCQPLSLSHQTAGSGKGPQGLLQSSVLEEHSSEKTRSHPMPESLSHACVVISDKVMVRDE